jgi:hypothetical protein
MADSLLKLDPLAKDSVTEAELVVDELAAVALGNREVRRRAKADGVGLRGGARIAAELTPSRKEWRRGSGNTSGTPMGRPSRGVVERLIS